LMGRWPLTILNYTSREMVETLRRLLREQDIDLLHVDSLNLAGCIHELSDALGNVPVIYNWHNIDSELLTRYAEHSRFIRKAYASVTAARLRDLETNLLQHACGHLVCSKREQKALQQRAPSARVEVIENGVDIAAFADTGLSRAPRHRVIFVGSMDYHPNVDAALYFAREIWPQLQSRLPQWKLTLVGSRPGPEISALAMDPSIEVTGTVPDVRPFYREAAAAVVPLRIGGGTRLKILEAMAAGVPVISTTLGAEGLEVHPGRNILIAHTEAEWDAALRMIRDEDRWRQFSTEGRAFVAPQYDWETIGKRLLDLYSGWIRI